MVACPVHLIGVPFNSAGTLDGVARAPAVLRGAGLVEALREGGLEVVDREDSEWGPTATERDPASHVIAPTTLAAMIRAVRAEVAETLGAGAFPLVLGGDCPVLLGCLGAPGLDSPPGLLFVDGHEDAWPPAASPTGEAADMELGFALGMSVAGLPDDLVREIPRLDPDAVVAVGPRDGRELEAAGVPSIRRLVHVITPQTASAAPEEVADQAASRLTQWGPWWLHVDLDVLSTESLAAVDYPQPGGLEWDELTRLSRRALARPDAIGLTVTIFNPDLDPDGSAGTRIVRYIVDALAGA